MPGTDGGITLPLGLRPKDQSLVPRRIELKDLYQRALAPGVQLYVCDAEADNYAAIVDKDPFGLQDSKALPMFVEAV